MVDNEGEKKYFNDYRSKFTGQASVILAVQIIRISLRVVATSTLNYLAAKIP